MDRFQPGEKLSRDLPRFPKLQGPAGSQGFRERRSVDVLHRHQLPTLLYYQIEDAAYVRRHHFSRRAHFLAQELPGTLVRHQLRTNRLQRHVHSKLQVECPVHLPHAPAAQDLPDLVTLSQNLTVEGRNFFERSGLERHAQKALRTQAEHGGVPRKGSPAVRTQPGHR
jgi:hypothetical protein